MPVKKLTHLAFFTAISMSIYAIESAIPPLVPIPGIKLGLANIITLILLHFYSRRDTLLVLLARIILSSLLFGQAISLVYSLAGGLLRNYYGRNFAFSPAHWEAWPTTSAN